MTHTHDKRILGSFSGYNGHRAYVGQSTTTGDLNGASRDPAWRAAAPGKRIGGVFGNVFTVRSGARRSGIQPTTNNGLGGDY